MPARLTCYTPCASCSLREQCFSDAKNVKLSPTFLSDLTRVYTSLNPSALSPQFFPDLKRVYGALPLASCETFQFLANRFTAWRQFTEDCVRTRIAELPEDDPLKCPISLFRTMDSGRLEIAHTRTLAWLLNPQREHGFRATLLAAVLRRKFGVEYGTDLTVTRATHEHPIAGTGTDGRLDIMMEGESAASAPRGWLLVIEAKVDAAEGEDQLQRYDAWIRSRAAGRDHLKLFLTTDGRQPESAGDTWQCLSFFELVGIFREAYTELRNAPGFHFLRFYLAGVLQDVCGVTANVGSDIDDPYAAAAYLKAVSNTNRRA